MGQATVSFDISLNVPAAKLWTVLVKDSPTYLPKILPAEHAATVECPDGRIIKAGSVRVWKSTTGDSSYIKDQYEELDEINYASTTKVLEARGLAQMFDGHRYKLKLNPGPDGSSTTIASWLIEMKASTAADETDQCKENITRTMKQAEAYILSNDVVVAA